MSSKISFIADSKEMLDLLERPFPAIKRIPDWMSTMPSYVDGRKEVDENNQTTSTIKRCMPVFDCLTAGYYIPLHSDVWVEKDINDNVVNMKWAWKTIEVVSAQNPNRTTGYPVPKGCYDTAFKWLNPWIVKTEPGWSCLFTHPLHSDDTPFHCLPGIVDTDKFPTNVNFPFYLDKTFTGLIQKGTPLIQVIPFKREDFKSEFSYDKKGLFKNEWTKACSVFFDRYKKFFRSSRKYEQGDVKKCPFSF